MNPIFQRPFSVKRLRPMISAVALSLLLVACSEPEPIVIDVSDINFNPTRAEIDAIFGIDTETPEPLPLPNDEPDADPTQLTFTVGPQSFSEFTENYLTGVGITKDTPAGQFYTRSNNTALLSGPVFGTGEVLNSDIRRIIPYTLNKLADGLELEAVYLLNGNNTTILDSDLAVGIVRNTSTRTRCSMRASGITLLDDQGNPSTEYIADRAGIKGASGTDTPFRDIPEISGCLSVGDYAYFRATVDAELTDIGGIAIEELDYLDRNYVITTPVMVPVTYTPTDNGLAVTVSNQSTLRLKVVGIDSVFLDEQGLPLGMDRWNPYPAETLAPGQEMVFNVEVEFRGSASAIRFLLDVKEGDRD